MGNLQEVSADVLNPLLTFVRCVSQSCMVASCSLSTKAVTYGLGRHVETVSHQDQIEVVKWIYLASCPGVLSLAVPKLAVITLLIRILVPGKAHRRFLWAMGIAVQLFFMTAVAMFLRVLIGKCPPFQEGQIPHNCVPPAMQVRYCLFAGCRSAPCPAFDIRDISEQGVVIADIH